MKFVRNLDMKKYLFDLDLSTKGRGVARKSLKKKQWKSIDDVMARFDCEMQGWIIHSCTASSSWHANNLLNSQSTYRVRQRSGFAM